MNSVWKQDPFWKLWFSASISNSGGYIQRNVKPKNRLPKAVFTQPLAVESAIEAWKSSWSKDQAWLVEKIGRPSCFFSKPVMIPAKGTWKWMVLVWKNYLSNMKCVLNLLGKLWTFVYLYKYICSPPQDLLFAPFCLPKVLPEYFLHN